MRTQILTTVAALAAAALVSPAFGAYTEQFDNLPVAGVVGTPPGAAVPLATGTWFFVNNSTPLGVTGVSRLPTTPGGTTPFPVSAADAPYYASMNFNNTTGAGTIDSFLMSPVTTFNNGDTISFITRTATDPAPTFPDRLLLKLSTAGASTSAADFTTTLLTINPNLGSGVADYPQDWTSYSATLSGLAGPTSGRFAFNYNVTSGGPLGDNSNIIGIDRAAFAEVPEPATLGALAGAAGLLAARKRRAK